MQVVAFSSPRSGHDGRDAELQQFERLAGTLSSQFARLHVEEIAPAILGALEQVGLAIDVQACALIEFTEGAIGAHAHVAERRCDLRRSRLPAALAGRTADPS